MIQRLPALARRGLAAAAVATLAGPAAAAGPAGLWNVAHHDLATRQKINDVQVCLGDDGRVAIDIWTGWWKASGGQVQVRIASLDGQTFGGYFLAQASPDLMAGTNQSGPPGDLSVGYHTTTTWTRLAGHCDAGGTR